MYFVQQNVSNVSEGTTPEAREHRWMNNYGTWPSFELMTQGEYKHLNIHNPMKTRYESEVTPYT